MEMLKRNRLNAREISLFKKIIMCTIIRYRFYKKILSLERMNYFYSSQSTK